MYITKNRSDRYWLTKKLEYQNLIYFILEMEVDQTFSWEDFYEQALRAKVVSKLTFDESILWVANILVPLKYLSVVSEDNKVFCRTKKNKNEWDECSRLLVHLESRLINH